MHTHMHTHTHTRTRARARTQQQEPAPQMPPSFAAPLGTLPDGNTPPSAEAKAIMILRDSKPLMKQAIKDKYKDTLPKDGHPPP